MLENYAFRLALFMGIGFGSVAEFFFVILRLMNELADLVGKEVE